MFDRDTEQRPEAFVVHETIVPLFHTTVTSALAIGA
jgi:hypothetical protein